MGTVRPLTRSPGRSLETSAALLTYSLLLILGKSRRPESRDAPSRQPALAAAVVLDVAVALAAAGGEAEVEFLDVVVGAQPLAGAVHDHPTILEDVAVVGIAERDVGVLLRQQEAHLALTIEPADDLVDLLDDLRREPHRGFVQQNHAGARHQRAAERGHLLLAAGDVARQTLPSLLEARKIGIYPIEFGAH